MVNQNAFLKNYLKEAGYVYKIQEESGGLEARSNQSDKNNHIKEEFNM